MNSLELKLAIEYLKRRSLSTEKVKSPRVIKIQVRVCPQAEVEAVLQMVLKEEFINFLKDPINSEYHDLIHKLSNIH